MQPLLAIVAQPCGPRNPQDEIAQDDPIYWSTLVAAASCSDGVTLLIKVSRETTDDN